jgi:hypothetical protein
MEKKTQRKNRPPPPPPPPVSAVGYLNCIYVADIAMLYNITGKKIFIMWGCR